MKQQHVLTLCCLVGASLALEACGGGASHEQTGEGAYNGKTAPAAISAPNAKIIVAATLNARDMQGLESLLLGQAASPQDKPGQAMLGSSEVRTRLKAAVTQRQSMSIRAAPSPVTQSQGSCGGSYTLQSDGDQTTYRFLDYCNKAAGVDTKGLIYNGAASIVDVLSADAIDSTLNFSLFSVAGTKQDRAVDLILSGTLGSKLTLNQDNTEFSAAFLARDRITDARLKVEDYLVRSDGRESSVSARVFLPQFGLVELTTETPLVFDNDSDSIRAGKLIFAGEKSRAMIEVPEANRFRLSMDQDGDGTSDFEDEGVWRESFGSTLGLR